MRRSVFPRLRAAREALARGQAEMADERSEANLLLSYAAKCDLAAVRAGEALEQQRQRNKELATANRDLRAEVADLKHAIHVLASRLGEAHAHLGVLDGDTVAEAITTRLPLVGVLGREYVHKLTGDRIRLVERAAPREWVYIIVGSTGSRWSIWDDDLANEYTAPEESTQVLATGGMS